MSSYQGIDWGSAHPGTREPRPRDESVVVGVVHPHQIARFGLEKVIADLLPRVVLRPRSSVAEMIERGMGRSPGLVVMELNMRLDECSLSALQKLRSGLSDTRILTMSTLSEKEIGIAALRYGADAFLPMSVDLPALREALVALLAGEHHLSPEMAAVLSDEAQGRNPRNGFARLSPREMDVIRQLIWGMQLKAVAAKLGLNIRTASCYKRNALAKLGMNSVAEVVRYSSENGIII